MSVESRVVARADLHDELQKIARRSDVELCSVTPNMAEKDTFFVTSRTVPPKVETR